MIGKYNNILSYIDSIIDEFEETREFTEEYLRNKDKSFLRIFSPEVNKDFFVERKKHILHLKNLCNQYIQNLCNHEFETDTIDITPDKSHTISYCKFCQMSQPGF